MKTTSLRLLLIEDDQDDYIITRELLHESTAYTFALTWAQDLAAAVEALHADTFDVVLLDLSLPDSQGMDTFSTISAVAPHTAIVLLTGLADETIGITAVQEGAQDYLVKSDIDSRLLLRSILYAIERKRTKEQLERYTDELSLKHRQMADDLHLAREVQQAFLPLRYPSFPPAAEPARSAIRFAHVYLPSEAVGGDFFSVIPVSDSRAGVFMCDVMGHGMRAALITAIVRGLLEETRPMAHDPGAFLTELSMALSRILKQLDQLVFVSALYALLDGRTGELCYASAGHPPPIHVHRHSGTAEILRADDTTVGPALCILPDHAYVSCCRRLEVGDQLILYTDGLVEMQGSITEDEGPQGLLETIESLAGTPPDRLLHSLVGEIRRSSTESEPSDDICAVCVEFTHPFPETPLLGAATPP